MSYPAPATEEAIKQGCTCDPEQQKNPNWQIITPKCPVHDDIEYMVWSVEQNKRKRRKR